MLVFSLLTVVFSKSIAQAPPPFISGIWEYTSSNINSIKNITINTNADSLNFEMKDIELIQLNQAQYGFVKFKLEKNLDHKLALLFNANKIINWGILSLNPNNRIMSTLPCFGTFTGMLADAEYFINGKPQSSFELLDTEIIAHYDYCMDENCLELDKDYAIWFKVESDLNIDHTKFTLFLSLNSFETEEKEMDFFNQLLAEKMIKDLAIKENFEN